MTRTALLQLTLLVLLVCGAVMTLLWWNIQKADLELQTLQSTVEAKKTELANLADMSAAQDKLDKLTLDEKETTQLALLRHLGLEHSSIEFQVQGKEERSSGDTTLTVRTIQLQKDDNYAEQMAFLDTLYMNGKLQIQKVAMQRSKTEGSVDGVNMIISGLMYSLQKTSTPTSSTQPEQQGGV